MARVFLLLMMLVAPGGAAVALESAKDAAGPKDKPPNCVVEVISVRKSGERHEREFTFHFATKKECEAAARGLRTNFAPQVVVSKKVTAKWRGD